MLKALILALISLAPLILPAPQMAYSSSGWQITVQTDKPHYYAGDTVYISGRLTYNDWPQQSVSVSIVANPFYSGTALTDNDGKYKANFTIGSTATPGQYTVIADYQGHVGSATYQVFHAIYIRATGEVEPADAPISRDGDVYTLTDNITIKSTDAIIIEKSDTILNGAGFVVQGVSLANSNGINLNSVSNVTLTNVSVRLFANGVGGYYSSNCNILDVNLSSDGYGIYFQGSKFNRIQGNNITGNSYAGIFLYSSQNNTINKNRLANTISSNLVGAIRLEYSSYNNLTGNNFVNNTRYGVYIGSYCYSNQIFHNNFINNTYQVYLDATSSLNGNVWDDGYPSGGNYWSDYTGADLYSGLYQNETGSDGIGDNPYVIDANNRDNYPLMRPDDPFENQTIHIRADGSVDPSGSPVLRKGDYYTLKDNIFPKADGIVIERDNMTMDGAGLALQGTGNRTGISLSGRSNVTIRNVNAENWTRGLWIESCSDCVIQDNSLNNMTYDIYITQPGPTPYKNNNSFINNTLNGAEIGFFSSQDDIYYAYNYFHSNHVENCKTAFEINLWTPCLFSDNFVESCDTAFQVYMHYCSLEFNRVVDCNLGFSEPYPYGNANVYKNNTAENCRVAFSSSAACRDTFQFNTALNCSVGFDTGDGAPGPNTCSWNEAINCTMGFVSGDYNQFRFNRAEGCTFGYSLTSKGYNGSSLGANVLENNTARNNEYGIFIDGSTANVISNNVVENNTYGVYSSNAPANNYTGNSINCNSFGFLLLNSSSEILRDNSFGNNTYGFVVQGWSLADFVQDIDVSNSINGRPVYYWVDVQDATVPSDAGCVALVNCSRIVVQNLNLTQNGAGILLAYTSNSTITKNNFAHNVYGIMLSFSFGNSVYHNNFTGNAQQSYSEESSNVWDNKYPSGGNYWSDYNGTDLYSGSYQRDPGSDGLGDTPYVIDSNNTDHYPLMRPAGDDDVALTDITANREWVYQGYSTNVNVTVKNNGDFAEAVTVTLYYNITANKIVGTQNVTLLVGENKTLVFAWNSGGVPYCENYTMTAVAAIPSDDNLSDNTLADDHVNVRILGDINGDGKVDVLDILICAKCFGSRPGITRWNPDADMNQDGKIDIIDLLIVAKHYEIPA